MALRQEIRNVIQRDIGSPKESDITNAGIYEHLRGVACKDRAKLEIGPKIANFET